MPEIVIDAAEKPVCIETFRGQLESSSRPLVLRSGEAKKYFDSTAV